MPTLNITLDERTQSVAAAQAAAAGFESVDAYITSLIESDVSVPISAELEKELLAGLASGPGVELLDADWEAKRQKLQARVVARTAS